MEAIDIAFSCYPVSSIKRARKFYEGVLGLKASSVWVKDDANGMVEYDIGPGTLAIGAGADNFKVGKSGVSVAIEVKDFEKAIKSLKGKNCTFIMDAMDTPVCNMALLEDPDGNKIMIHRRKSRAAASG